MKHSEWLRLKAQGENICAILRQCGYRCTKQTRRLSWKITTPHSSPRTEASSYSPPLPRGDGGVRGETERDYVLTWLPTPVGDWTLVPNDNTPTREQLRSIVQTALKKSEQAEHTTSHSLTGNLNRPWAIARILPDARHYIVARFVHRQDANDHLRFLQRFIPAAEFEIVFDVPNEQDV
jgi:hypothetical protein